MFVVKFFLRRLTHKFTTAYGFSELFMSSPKPTVENLWIMREIKNEYADINCCFTDFNVV